LKTASPEDSNKAVLDALLLKIRGVEAGVVSGLQAYFVSKRMFACIHGGGVALRLPVATATELQFSRADVVPFQPNGKASTREWIQINRADFADYKQDLEFFEAAIKFATGAK
jgi:hypothetical protein